MHRLTPQRSRRLNTALGKLLKERRKYLSITQSELAKLLCLDQSAVSRIERGMQHPTAVHLLVLWEHDMITNQELFRVLSV